MAEKLATIQAAIRKSDYNWQAGTTSVSELSVPDIVARLGLRVNETELKAAAKAISAAEALTKFAAASIPPSVDWRNHSGNWVTPIKDQMTCGSCVSFGTLATMESRIRLACKNAAMNIDLSEAQLFYCGCGNCCGSGWNFAPALDYCKSPGIGVESDFPYTPGDQPCKTIATFAKIKGWNSVIATADRKSVLSSKGPMVAGMAVYSDFPSYTGGVYRRTSGSVLRGYHCISVIGYDDARQCWICKNSWSSGWGENGFFNIGYGECSIDTEFLFYDMDVDCPKREPADECSRYVVYLRGILLAARTHATLRAYLRYYICGRGAPPIVYNAAAAKVTQSVRIVLMHCPQYRAPFCQILG